MRVGLTVMSVAAAVGCQSAAIDKSERAEPSEHLVESFPGIWVDREARTVEFLSVVPIDAAQPEGVLLESVVCIPDTREHESLLMARVRPSEVHQALLQIGLHPGAPAHFDFVGGRLVAIDPIGPRLVVTLHWVDELGQPQSARPSSWVIDPESGTHLPSSDEVGWVFAGSGFTRGVKSGVEYHADRDGTLIGLAAFGTETIAYADAFSPESAYADQVWIADEKAVPPVGTSVTVRIRPKEPRP